jgi:hypothetical protein
MSYSNRIFLWAPLAFLLVIALTVSARWWSVANELSKRLDAMNGLQPMPGVTMRFASKTISGFPFNVDAVFRDMAVTVAGPHGPIGWRTENFAAHALTYGRSQWLFEAAGKQHFRWTTKNGQAKGLGFETGSLHAGAIFSDDALSRFDLDIVGFNSAALASARTQIHLRHNGEQIDLVASAEEMHLSPALRGACGEVVDRLRFEGNLSNAEAFEKVRRALVTWQSAFDTWRGKGGRFFIAQGELACAKTNTFVQGQLALDAQKRPRGLLTARIAGFGSLRENAERSHASGTFISGLLTQPIDPDPAHEGRVTVRAGFRDGITYLGDTPAGMNDPLY